MRTNFVLAPFFAGLLVAGTVQAADKYEIDGVHSKVGFTVTHMVVSEVDGHFNDFSGAIQFDEKAPQNSSVEVTIKTASIDTENEKRDGHLKSADFFDAEKFPEITFKSSKVLTKGEGFIAVGTLTMRGVAKEVQIPFTVKGPVKGGNASRIGVLGTLELNRQDYGVSWSKTLDGGGLAVSDTVQVVLKIEAIHEAPAAEAGK